VEAIYRDEKEVSATRSGENLRLRVTGAEETDIQPGFVLSSIKVPVPMVTQFEAQLMIVELLEHNSVFTVCGGCTVVRCARAGVLAGQGQGLGDAHSH
jgi:peptide chain release factor subunit 3